jgi:hypothetical protein
MEGGLDGAGGVAGAPERLSLTSGVYEECVLKRAADVMATGRSWGAG